MSVTIAALLLTQIKLIVMEMVLEMPVPYHHLQSVPPMQIADKMDCTATGERCACLGGVALQAVRAGMMDYSATERRSVMKPPVLV
jgi:hypothetical protein